MKSYKDLCCNWDSWAFKNMQEVDVCANTKAKILNADFQGKLSVTQYSCLMSVY